MTARRGRNPTAIGFTGVNCGDGVRMSGRRIVIFLISLGDGMSRAKTSEEMRDMLLAHFRNLTYYWSHQEMSDKEKLDGLLHSILVALDGHAGGFPCSLDLVCRPHPDDKQFYIDEGEDWIEDGMVINDDVLLHDQ